MTNVTRRTTGALLQDNCLFKICPNADKEDDAELDVTWLASLQTRRRLKAFGLFILVCWVCNVFFVTPLIWCATPIGHRSEPKQSVSAAEGSVTQFFNVFDWVCSPQSDGFGWCFEACSVDDPVLPDAWFPHRERTHSTTKGFEVGSKLHSDWQIGHFLASFNSFLPQQLLATQPRASCFVMLCFLPLTLPQLRPVAPRAGDRLRLSEPFDEPRTKSADCADGRDGTSPWGTGLFLKTIRH